MKIYQAEIMDLVGIVNRAIESPDTEASSGSMSSLLGTLNSAPLNSEQIREIARSIQGLLNIKGGAGTPSTLIDVLQTVATTGEIENLVSTTQVDAIAQRVGTEPAMVRDVSSAIAQFLVKGSTPQGYGLLQKAITNDIDLGQIADLTSLTGKFLNQ